MVYICSLYYFYILNSQSYLQMNVISDHLRQNLMNRLPRTEDQPSSSSPEDKLMNHFEAINKAISNNPNNRLLANKEDKYEQVILGYSSTASAIDSIVASNEDSTHLAGESEKIVKAPLIPNLKPSSYEQIKTIRDMFEGRSLKQNLENHQNTLLVVEQYAQILMSLGRHNRAAENKALAKSKAIIKNPTLQQFNIKEIQTDQKEFESANTLTRQFSREAERSKRKDLILMEILREKKRKDYAQDYFGVMELKLMELLDFILEDEEEYMGLDPEVKIKTVLAHLERFQGKIIEGQSKINLLRIFFEEFTSLKREKDELEALKTPMRKLQNKEKPQNTSSTKAKQIYSTTTPQRKSTAGKIAKKGSHIKWIEHQAVDRKRKGSKLQNHDRPDQWIGSLH